MVKAVVLYADEPDPERYAEHVELCRRVEGAVFRHGRVFGAPAGAPRFHYYAEWEFPDLETFQSALRSPEFAATGKDAQELGCRFEVLFGDVS